MADNNNIRIPRRAQLTLNELPPAEGDQVVTTVDTLAHTPPTKWPVNRARVFPGDPSLYLVKVNSSLRVILRVVERQPFEILDVIRRETLDSFAKMAANATD